MQTFDQALFAHVHAGRVTRDDALAAATSPQDFKLLLAAEGRVGTTMDDVLPPRPSAAEPPRSRAHVSIEPFRGPTAEVSSTRHHASRGVAVETAGPGWLTRDLAPVIHGGSCPGSAGGRGRPSDASFGRRLSAAPPLGGARGELTRQNQVQLAPVDGGKGLDDAGVEVAARLTLDLGERAISRPRQACMDARG